MCVSHPDEEEPITAPKGGHKRNLSNGTPENSPLRRTKRQKSRVNLKEASSSEDSEPEDKATPEKASRTKKTQVSSIKKEETDNAATETTKGVNGDQGLKEEDEDSSSKPQGKASSTPAKQTKPAKRGKKTKEEKDAEAMPLAPRTPGLRMFVGAHVSAAKGKYY